MSNFFYKFLRTGTKYGRRAALYVAAIVIVCAIHFLIPAPATAQLLFGGIWSGTGDGVSWNDPPNWFDGQVPDQADIVQFGLFQRQTDVNLPVGATAAFVRLDPSAFFQPTLDLHDGSLEIVNSLLLEGGVNSQWSTTTRFHRSAVTALTVDLPKFAYLELLDSTTLTSSEGNIGSVNAGEAKVTVQGGSTWNLGVLNVGPRGAVDVFDSAITSNFATINGGTLTSSPASVFLFDSTFGSLGSVTIGRSEAGSVSMIADSQFNADLDLFLGYEASGSGEIEVGSGLLDVQRDIVVGRQGFGRVTFGSTGTVNSESANLGRAAGSRGIVDMTIPEPGFFTPTKGVEWFTSDGFAVGVEGEGTMTLTGRGTHLARVDNDGAMEIGQVSGSVGTVGVGYNGRIENAGNLFVGHGGTGSLHVSSNGFVNNRLGSIGFDAGSNGDVTVSGPDARWVNSNGLVVGKFGTGILSVAAGGSVSNTGNFNVGLDGGGSGVATVTGANSEISSTGDVRVGGAGTGRLTIDAGAHFSSSTTTIGYDVDGDGRAVVRGSGSTFNVGMLVVGGQGQGVLDVESGGEIQSQSAVIGFAGMGVGTSTLDGMGSSWNVNGNLNVGGLGTGVLNINNQSLVNVSGNTAIGLNSEINLGGGRLEFGNMSGLDLSKIAGTGGSLAGDVHVTRTIALSSLAKPAFDVSDVALDNSGMIFGTGNFDGSLTNLGNGRIELSENEQMGFFGAANIDNFGVIDSQGGNLRFVIPSVTNHAGGEISGYGTFFFAQGISNAGSLLIDGPSTTQYFGQLDHLPNGSVQLDSSVIFHDAVIHNGNEFVVNSGSAFFGGRLSGPGGFTGEGNVQVNDTYAPGNSVAIIGIEADLYLTANSLLEIELEGTVPGEFDRLNVGGDLYLQGGTVDFEFADGFQSDSGDDQIFLDVTGERFGQFINFDEGALVQSVNGRDWFITYLAGDGNDVALFTEIGKPGDFNDDGVVDADDIDFYIGKIGLAANGELQELDLDEDGQVTLADHELLVTTLFETSNGEIGSFLGDANADGQVDVLQDAVSLVNNLGNSSGQSWRDGDFNADGAVDVLNDAAALINNLGNSNNASATNAATTAVPEPATFSLLIVAAVATISRRRRVQR